MDSISNLPLLEIAAEDDSLLFVADDDATTSATTSSATAKASTAFACSPLLSLRSLHRTDGRVGALDSENAISATKEAANSNNKENLNWNNKPEALKLNVEPQQMKRKKKGGGYNLRKSLAWDRAFFTEEGVLNPLELSMISGTATPKRTNNMELKAIYEEEPGSASLALQEIEENLFKQSSDGGACHEDINNGSAGLSPKSGATNKYRAPPSLAKRKVLAVNDVVGNISKRNACPRPVAPSSFELAKAPKKESKVTKIPGPKSNVSGITSAARSGKLSAGLAKRNQSAHPATNVQKYAGAKGLSKNPRTAPTNPKVDMASKCSVTRTLKKQAEKHLDSSVSETPPPPRLHPPGTGAQKVSEACLSQGISDTGEKKQPRQFQTSKPSGLRMPSPSLGFFSQAKTPSSHSQLQKSSKPCKPAESNIPKLRKLDTHSVNEAKLPPAPRKRSEIVEGATNNCTKKLSLSDVKSKASMQVDNNQIAGVEVECDSLDFEKINKQEMVDIKQTAGLAAKCHSLGLENPSGHILHTVLGGSMQGIPYKNVEQINNIAGDFGKLGGDSQAHLFNGNLSVNCNNPTQSTFEVVIQQLQGDLSIVEEISSENENESQGNSCKLVHVTTLSSKCSPEKAILEIDHACESDPKVAESGDLQHPVDDQSGFIQSRSVDEGCHQVIDSKGLHNRTQAVELDRMYEDSTAVHVTTLSCNCSPEKPISEMVSACESEPKVAESEDCQHPVDEQSCFIQRRPVDEGCDGVIDSKGMQNRTQAFELDRICEDSTAVHVRTLSSKCSPEKAIPEIDSACESEPKVAGEDCQHPVDNQPCFIQRRPVDEGCDRVNDSKGMQNRTQAFELDRMCEDSTAVDVTTLSSKCSPAKSIPEINGASESEPKVTESEDCQHPVDHQSDFIEIRPVDERYHHDIDSEGMNNETQAFELDRMCEDSIAVSATVCSTKVSNVSPESRPFYENNTENLHFPVQLCPMVKADGDSSRNDMLISDHCTISEWQLRGDGSCRSSSSRCDVQCDVPRNFVQQVNTLSEWQLREDGSSMDTLMHFDVCGDVPENFEQQADSRTHSETNEMICEDDNLVANHGQLLDESEYFGVTVDFISNMEDSICGGSENPSGLLQQSVLTQSDREFDHTNRESEESHLGDEQAQSILENPVVYKYKNEHCLSATNYQFSLVGDKDKNDESHLSELQRPIVVGENSQQFSNIMHLDGDRLPANTAYSEENKQQISFEGASEGCNIFTSEYNVSNHHTQSMPESIDGNLDVDEVECLQMGDVKNGCTTNILPSVEVELNHEVISGDFDSSIKMSEDGIAEVVNWKSDELCSSSENSKLPASNDLPFHTSTQQGSEVSPLNNNKCSQEPETNIFEKDEFPNTDMQHQTKGNLGFEEDSSKLTLLEKYATESRPEVPSVKLPPNAVPFSDEWLAAIEAAGEEILTMKGGAVQNSPPEKPQHEPGPWSPVKRKNQTIGPFDCTKHTNIPHPNSS